MPKDKVIKITITIQVIIKSLYSTINSNATRENVLLLRSHENFIGETAEAALRTIWELLLRKLVKMLLESRDESLITRVSGESVTPTLVTRVTTQLTISLVIQSFVMHFFQN